jgi:rSAM/selenodomain-associated transferase 2
MRRWLGPGLHYRPQGDGDLGRRIERAFEDAFASGSDRVVIIGCDSPELDWPLLARAFAALEQSDLVVGPARDGGYYLIGLKRPTPGLCQDIQWGTEQVLAQTLRIAAQLRLRRRLLPELDDVDRPADLPVWERARRHAATLAVIIPALDEAERLVPMLSAVTAENPDEVIVVDGGSRDRTVEVARAAGATVILAPRGRARQMNTGARSASAAQLMFLHADTLPPRDYRATVWQILQRPGICAGAFAFSIREPIPRRRLVEWLVEWRCRLFNNPFGDQGLFLSRELFEAVGGFPDWPVLEDVEMLRRLKAHGRLAIAPTAASTSGRRWLARGVWSTFWLNQRIMLGYYAGVSVERMAQIYRSPRQNSRVGMRNEQMTRDHRLDSPSTLHRFSDESQPVSASKRPTG